MPDMPAPDTHTPRAQPHVQPRATWPTNWPVYHLHTPQGDTAVISQHGAQVLSWRTANGAERLFLSPAINWQDVANQRCAIRGGIPVCWPQFNRRGKLPKHGFARLLPWALVEQNAHSLRLRLCQTDVPSAWLHDAQGTPLWPYAFETTLQITLAHNTLTLHLQVRNTGYTALSFTTAFHGYWATHALHRCAIHGAQGQVYWDATPHAYPTHPTQYGPIRFAGEVDRVYPAFTATLTQEEHTLRSSQSPSLAQTVVWNPGAKLCAQLADLQADNYQHFVCIEAAQIDTPVLLPPGAVWQGWQSLQTAV